MMIVYGLQKRRMFSFDCVCFVFVTSELSNGGPISMTFFLFESTSFIHTLRASVQTEKATRYIIARKHIIYSRISVYVVTPTCNYANKEPKSPYK